MAASESDPRLAKVYANLAAMEEGHIGFWERAPATRRRDRAAAARLVAQSVLAADRAASRPRSGAGHHRGEGRPSTRTATSGSRRPPAPRCRPTSAGMRRVLGQLVATQPRGLQGSFLGRLEGRHRSVGRQRAARGGPRRQRRALLESEPGHGRGRRRDRQPRHSRHRPGGAAGRCLFDGARRVGVGDQLARARAARDPHRGERAQRGSRGRRRGAAG